jgi:hypothetical protein
LLQNMFRLCRIWGSRKWWLRNSSVFSVEEYATQEISAKQVPSRALLATSEIFFRNVCWLSKNCMTLYTIRQNSSCSDYCQLMIVIWKKGSIN